MAAGIMYLRPSADTTLAHSLYPSSSANGYSLISEEISDEDSTYIYSADNKEVTSEFTLTGVLPNEPFSITSATLYFSVYYESPSTSEYRTREGGSSGNIIIDENNVSYSVPLTSVSDDCNKWIENKIVLNDVINMINSYMVENNAFPNISIQHTTYVSTQNEKEKTHEARTTQIYLKLEYGDVGSKPIAMEIYKKINGAWSVTTNAYQKTDGVWVEITEDECRSILSTLE